MSATIVINYNKVIECIGEQLQSVWYALKQSGNQEILDTINTITRIDVSDEQSFNIKRGNSQLEKGALYIVVKFGNGPINYATSVAPISLLTLGTANKVRPAQLLLSVFSSTWTTKNLNQDLQDGEGNSLEDADTKQMLQVWNTPEIVTNFNEVYSEFRNLFRVSGNIVFGPSAVRVGTLTYYWGTGSTDYETINIMSFQDGYRASMDSQPFGNTEGFAQSETNFSTYTFAISTYLLNNHLSADLLAIRGFRNRNGGSISSTFGPNDKMRIQIKFTNGFDNFVNSELNPTQGDTVWSDNFFEYFKIVDSQIGQEIGGIPTVSITFTR